MNDEERQKEELLERVEKSMTNHTPSASTIIDIEHVREAAKVLAHDLIEAAPISRELSLALTHLEDAVMWGVKAMVLPR